MLAVPFAGVGPTAIDIISRCKFGWIHNWPHIKNIFLKYSIHWNITCGAVLLIDVFLLQAKIGTISLFMYLLLVYMLTGLCKS